MRVVEALVPGRPEYSYVAHKQEWLDTARTRSAAILNGIQDHVADTALASSALNELLPPRNKRCVQNRRLDRVRNITAQCVLPHIRARRIHPIGQQNHEHPTLRIDPDTRTRKSGMTKRTRGEIPTSARLVTRRIPAKCSAGFVGLPRGPARDCSRLNEAHTTILPAIQ